MQKESYNIFIIIKIFILLFILTPSINSLNPYMKKFLTFPQFFETSPIKVSINKISKEFYKLNSKSILKNQIWLTSNSNYSITNSFITNILKFQENQILKIELKYNNNQLLKFELIMEEDKNYITISSCDIIKSTITKTESILNCKNELGDKVNIKYLINSYKITPPNFDIINNDLKKNPLNILEFFISIENIINEKDNLKTSDKLNQVNFILNGDNNLDLYLFFDKLEYFREKCPPGCLLCNENRECSKCYDNFKLSTGRCNCQDKLANGFDLDLSYKLFFKNLKCDVIQDNDITLNQFADCENKLEDLLKESFTTVHGFATFNQKQIQLQYLYITSSSFEFVDKNCFSDLKIYHVMNFLENSVQNVFYELVNDYQFEEDKKYTLTFPDFDYCEQILYEKYSLKAYICNLTTFYGYKKSDYNNNFQNLTQKYIMIQSTKDNTFVAKGLIPVYKPNENISNSNSNNLTIRICDDSLCFNNLTKKDFVKTKLLYIKVIIEDPLYINFKPEMKFSLFINDEKRNSLLKNIKEYKELIVPQFLITILVDSAELINETNFLLKINYKIQEEDKNIEMESKFKLNIIDPFENQNSKGFYNSLGFVFILFTFGGVFLLGILGVFSYLISKALGKDVNVEKNDSEIFIPKNIGRDFEMTKQNSEERQEVNDLLNKLM